MAANRARGNMGPVKYGAYLRERDEANDKKNKISELKDMLFADISDPDFSAYKKVAQGSTRVRRDVSPLKDMFGIGGASYREEYVGPSMRELNSVEAYNGSVERRAKEALEQKRFEYAAKVYNGEIIHTGARAKALNNDVFSETNWEKIQTMRDSFFGGSVTANDEEVQAKINELKARPVTYSPNPDWDKYHGVMPNHYDPDLEPWYPDMKQEATPAQPMVQDMSMFDTTDSIKSMISAAKAPETPAAPQVAAIAGAEYGNIPTAVEEDYRKDKSDVSFYYE